MALRYNKDKKRIVDELAKADISFMISVHEGFGFVGWEAIGAGIPLVLTKESGLFKLLERETDDMRKSIYPVSISNNDDNDMTEVTDSIWSMRSEMAEANAAALKLKNHLKEKYTWKKAVKIFADKIGISLKTVDTLSSLSYSSSNHVEPANRLFVKSKIEQLLNSDWMELFKKYLVQKLSCYNDNSSIADALTMKEVTYAIAQLSFILERTNCIEEMKGCERFDDHQKNLLNDVENIVAWLVLLTVSEKWLNENKDKLRDEDWKITISLPTQSELGTEIVISALKRRQCRFNCDDEIVKGAKDIGRGLQGELSGFIVGDPGWLPDDIVTRLLKELWSILKISKVIPKEFKANDLKILNNELEIERDYDEGYYLIVAGKDSALRSEDVYNSLNEKVPLLDIILIGVKGDRALDCDEDKLHSYLRRLFRVVKRIKNNEL